MNALGKCGGAGGKRVGRGAFTPPLCLGATRASLHTRTVARLDIIRAAG